MQHGGLDVTGQDGVAHVVGAVEAHHDDAPLASRLERCHGPHGHGVVTADDALDVGVGLNDRFHLLIGLGLTPVGALTSHHLHLGILVDDIMVALGADASVGVGLLAHQFHVGPFFAHQFHELLGAEFRALVVIRNNLGHGHAGLVHFTVDEKSRDAGFFRFLHRSDGGVRTGIVEDDGRRLAGDGGVEQLVLLVGIIIMDKDQSIVAKFLGFGFSAHCLGLEERIVLGGHDNDY